MSVSRLGFGVSGAHGTPLVSRAATRGLVHAAFEAGVTLFDTAPAYGAGEAERRLGLALSDIGRDRVTLSTKAGLSSAGFARRLRDFTPDGIEASVRASLKRLGVEGVDLLWLHGAGAGELTEALFDRLDALKRAGAFKRLGAAGRGGELDAAVATGRFDALMAPVHPFLGEAESARLQAAREAGLSVFAIETAGDAPAPLRLPRRPGDLYALAKGVRARATGAGGRGRVRHAEGLCAAIKRPWVDRVLMTTTRDDHLKDAVNAAGSAGEAQARR